MFVALVVVVTVVVVVVLVVGNDTNPTVSRYRPASNDVARSSKTAYDRRWECPVINWMGMFGPTNNRIRSRINLTKGSVQSICAKTRIASYRSVATTVSMNQSCSITS